MLTLLRDVVSVEAFCVHCLGFSVRAYGFEYGPSMYDIAIRRVKDAVETGFIPGNSVAVTFQDALEDEQRAPATIAFNWESGER